MKAWVDERGRRRLRRIETRVLSAWWAAILLCGCGRHASARASGRYRARVHKAGSDLEVLEKKVTLELDEQGRLTRRVRSRTRIHTYFGVQRFSDPRIPFVKGRHRVKVRRAAAIAPDGREVTSRPWARNVLLPRWLARAPAYASRRELVASFLGVERGAVVELDYEVADLRPADLGGGWATVVLGSAGGPTKKAVVRLTADSNRKVAAACLGCTAHRTAAERAQRPAGRKTHSWEVTGLKATNVWESPGVGGRDRWRLPVLIISTAPGWSGPGKALAARWARASRPSQGVRELAGRLTDEVIGVDQKVVRLQRFVSESVRTVRVDWPLQGWPIAPAEQVARRLYGHELDKAALLAALLSAIGLRAEPVVFSRAGRLSLDVVHPGVFDRAGLEVGVEGRRVWLPVSERGVFPARTRPAAGFRWAFARPRSSPEKVQMKPSRFVRKLDMKLVGGDDGDKSAIKAEVSGTVWGSGRFNPYGRVDVTKGSEIDKLASGWISGLRSASVRAAKLSIGSSAFAVEGEWKVSSVGRRWGAFVLPLSTRAKLDRWEIARSRRTTGLRLEGPWSETLDLKVCGLGSKLQLRSAPRAFARKNEFGELVRTVTREGGCLRIRQRLEIRRSWITPRGYASFRSMLDPLLTSADSKIIFERK